MLKYVFTALIALATLKLSAQSRTLFTVGFSVSPSYTDALVHSTSNAGSASFFSPFQTVAQYADSVDRRATFKPSFGCTAWINYLLSANWYIQTGIGYNEFGYATQNDNLKLGDQLYPGIGNSVITDATNVQKGIRYNYRFQYVSVPVIFNYYLKRSDDFAWTSYFSFGASSHILVNQKMTARLEQFYMDDKNVFHIDSTGHNMRPIALSLQAGARFDYKLDNSFSAFIQPLLLAFPFSVSTSIYKANPFGFVCNAGIVYNIPKKDK
jgi:hypothetical protein